jgi:16S rRNA (guanine966-N2)-methyltransferase
MRVIAGRLGGRNFDAPRGHRTHPMSDRMRGALFNALGELDGLTALDCYAGSGALSFEAISRGAISADMVDEDKQASECIRNNISMLGLERQARIIRSRIKSWSRKHPAATFDVVLADPPYDAVSVPDIQKLTVHVKPGGVFALSWPSHLEVPVFPSLALLKDKEFGNARLAFYRKT